MALELNIASPRLRKDPTSEQLIGHLKDVESELRIDRGVVYYDFPLFRDADDVLYRSQLMLASRSHGLALFAPSDLTDRTCTHVELARVDDELSQLHSIVYGRLLKSRLLRASRQELLFKPLAAIYLPNVGKQVDSSAALESDIAQSLTAVDELLSRSQLRKPLSDAVWAELRAILEGAKGLVRPKERIVPQDAKHGKAGILQALESEVANFDAQQRRAAISIVEGPQRIRGLAGSGKTVVLAMKAAYIHLSQPDARILVTFHTKSLYDFIKRLITRFYRQFNDHDPDFEDRLHVYHSWGGTSLEGVYYNACLDAGVQPKKYGEATGRSVSPFDYVCDELVKTERVVQKYDYVLIDEAQDQPVSFFRLCFQLAQGGAIDRNIIWAYDELQNIINVRTISPRQAFGVGRNGTALIDLDRSAEAQGALGTHDIVLHKCYRNPREILLISHALGFGIYSDTMVQMLENKEHWEDVGYAVETGNCKPGEFTSILRPEQNSPLSISSVQSPRELIQYYVADDFDDEVNWVIQGVQDMMAEGLRPDDIMVVSLDDRNARTYFNNIALALAEIGVSTNNVLASGAFSAPKFVVEKEVTLSTVYRAKGNEAPVVFVVGVEALYPSRKFKRSRNKLFTAFTRARGWLRISGVGESAQFFFSEIETALLNLPRLEFVYPNVEAVERIQRDLSDKASRMRKLQVELEEQMELLDLDEEDRDAFAESIKRGRRR